MRVELTLLGDIRMKRLHTRVVVISYFEDEVPLHTTLEEQQEWYAALGRMVAYGLHDDRNKAEDSSTQLVRLGLRNKPMEIDACYHIPVPVMQPRYADGVPKYIGIADHHLHELQDSLTTTKNCFVMGAVRHPDGKWGFHS